MSASDSIIPLPVPIDSMRPAPITPSATTKDELAYYLAHRKLEEALANKVLDVDFLKKLYQLLQAIKNPMLAFVRLRDEFLPAKANLSGDDQKICARKTEGMAVITNLMADLRTQFNGAREWPAFGWDPKMRAAKFLQLFEFIVNMPGVKDFSPIVAKQVKQFGEDFTKNVLRLDLKNGKYGDLYKNAPLFEWVQDWFSAGLFGSDSYFKDHGEPDPIMIVKQAFMYMDQLGQYLGSSSAALQNLVRQSVADQQTELGAITRTQKYQVGFEQQVNRLCRPKTKKHP